jgi:DNA modification methylase
MPLSKIRTISPIPKPELSQLISAHGNRLNDLSSTEWVRETVSVWTQKGLGKNHKDTVIERQHPAPFSFQDVERIIRFFTKAGDMVLDPFVGVGSTLKAAALSGRHGVGIELNSKYADLARQRLAAELEPGVLDKNPQRIIWGDARRVLPTLPPASMALVVTSPPYWNILRKIDHKARQERLAFDLDTDYGKDPLDLGNIERYETFVETLAETLATCGHILKPKGHMALVVGDFRHKSRYHMFHADIAGALEAHEFILKGILILYQSQKRVFPYGYPTSFVPNLHHQYIVVLQKANGD